VSLWQILGDSFIVVFFVLLNGFFVATEYAIVKVRFTQIEPLVKRGNRRAKIAKEILSHMNMYLSATQLGVTMTSLALGWIGQPLAAKMLSPLFHLLGIAQPSMVQAVSFGVAFSLITAIHIIVGEQAPKFLAIQKAAPVILTVSYPFRLFYIMFRPIIILLNTASSALLRAAGLRATLSKDVEHSEEELRLILAQDRNASTLSRMIVLRAMDFRQKLARHAMIPRTGIVALSADAPWQENLKIIRANKYSRFPVFKEGIDNIVGIVYTKDIFKQDLHHQAGFTLQSVLHDAVFLPETASLEHVLSTILQKKVHMIVLADEYGGTAGLITLENVLEELVGNIQDEYDREAPELTKISDNEYLIDGSITTNDVERMFDAELSPFDIRTIGGFAIEQLGHFPDVGEHFRSGNLEITIEKVFENTVSSVRVKRLPPPSEQP
jgi:CBS domain containing-hemolysin-like protein